MELKLRGKEIRLLKALIAHAPIPVSPEELLREVWGYVATDRESERPEGTRTVLMTVARLRKTIGPELIITVGERSRNHRYLWVGPKDYPVPTEHIRKPVEDASPGRIGSRRRVGIGVRRNPVWYLVCDQCGKELDVNAYLKRNKVYSEDEENEAFSQFCTGTNEQPHDTCLMENKGLYLMLLHPDGRKERVESASLRAEWAKARERWLKRKPICVCGHHVFDHHVVHGRAHQCRKLLASGGWCECGQFKPAPEGTPLKDEGPTLGEIIRERALTKEQVDAAAERMRQQRKENDEEVPF